MKWTEKCYECGHRRINWHDVFPYWRAKRWMKHTVLRRPRPVTSPWVIDDLVADGVELSVLGSYTWGTPAVALDASLPAIYREFRRLQDETGVEAALVELLEDFQRANIATNAEIDAAKRRLTS